MRVNFAVILLIGLASTVTPVSAVEMHRCAPVDVTMASSSPSGHSVAKTSVNWNRIEYRVEGDTATLSTFKDSASRPAADPIQRDQAVVLQNSKDKIVLISKSGVDLTVDVIFPQDGNAYSFYASDYPKRLAPGNAKLTNLAKLYVLKCVSY